jgi:hypothetical protein
MGKWISERPQEEHWNSISRSLCKEMPPLKKIIMARQEKLAEVLARLDLKKV